MPSSNAVTCNILREQQQQQPSQDQLRRTLRRVQKPNTTKAEFRRLKTILPSIKRKENVSRLDIILEAIKYIDDLQDQLIDRLSGPKSEREAALVALTEQDMAEHNREVRVGEDSEGQRTSEEEDEDDDELQSIDWTTEDKETEAGSLRSLLHVLVTTSPVPKTM